MMIMIMVVIILEKFPYFYESSLGLRNPTSCGLLGAFSPFYLRGCFSDMNNWGAYLFHY